MSSLLAFLSRKPKQLAADDQPVGAAVERPEYIRRRSFGELLRGDLGFLPVLATLLVVVIFFQITTNGLFLTPRNLSSLVQQNAEIGIAGPKKKDYTGSGKVHLS